MSADDTIIDIDGTEVSGNEDVATALQRLSEIPAIAFSVKNVPLRVEMLPTTAHPQSKDTLLHLTLDNVRLTAAIARRLQRLLFPSSSQLQTLNCSNNPKLGPRGLPAVLQCCSSATTTTLCLNRTGLGPFCQPPEKLPVLLDRLELAGNNLGIAALYKWQQPLAHCRSLHTLDVSDNALGDDGIRALSGVLQTVVSFSAAGNGITTWEEAAPALQYLDLSRNSVEDEGVQKMVKSWNKTDSVDEDTEEEIDDDDEEDWQSLAPLNLRYLNLAHNRIASPGSTALAQGLRGRAPELHSIHLEHNAMDDAGADAWVDAVDDLPALRLLDVTPCTAARTDILQLLLKHRRSRTETKDSIETSSASGEAKDDDIDDEVRGLLRDAMDGGDFVELPQSTVAAITKDFTLESESRGAFGLRYCLKGITESPLWIRRCGQKNLDLEILKELHRQQHPHLLPVTAFTDEGCVFYQSEGRTLHEILNEKRRFSASRALSLATCLAEALAFLHDHGVFHGDVQSETVFICSHEDGIGEIAKLTDPGLAGSFPSRTYGTAGYRCPRFERGSVPYSTLSDIFSLGIVAAELVTGKLQNSTITGSNVAWDAFYDLEDHPGLLVGAPDEIQKVISKCLTHVVDQRPSAHDVVVWLTET